MRTDPEKCDYVFTRGARRKMEEWSAESNEGIELQTEEEKEKRRTDPMYRMEKNLEDIVKGKSSVVEIGKMWKN